MTAAPRRAIFLMGPTGSGKTDLSLRLCERLSKRSDERAACEIVSVDSMLVYRGMDIGTAKPAPGARRKIPHHLIDILEPSETYSAADFTGSALDLIDRILMAGRLPLLVGGTMFYFHALEHGLDRIPDVDDGIKREIAEQERKLGLAVLYDELCQVDAVSAARLHPNDSQRIKRALEVYRASGCALSEFQSGQGKRKAPFLALKFGLNFRDRSVLRDNIEHRFDEMLAAGLIDEVGCLMLRGDLNRRLPSVRAVGYRQVWTYLLGEYDYGEMRTQAVNATRQLAKRQLTWMRSMESVRCWEVDRISREAFLTTLEHETIEFSRAII